MKQAFFFIDDTIWCLRDLTRERPASVWDNAFFAMLKKAHDEYGMAVQLDIFYRTDFFYGGEEFTLADMTDAYKGEFEAASDWLRFAFHAKQEFPDYPYLNAEYDDVKRDCEEVHREIIRFAGERSLSDAVVVHWMPISKDGCRALCDCGIRIVSPSYGDRTEFTGDDTVLPYGHSARLRQNRKPESMLYTRPTNRTDIASSICGYNHIESDRYGEIYHKNASLYDEETGVYFHHFEGGPTLNTHTYDEVDAALGRLIAEGAEHIPICVHEQYFYPDYYAYQPDYAEKIYLLGRRLTEAGYKFITGEELK